MADLGGAPNGGSRGVHLMADIGGAPNGGYRGCT